MNLSTAAFLINILIIMFIVIGLLWGIRRGVLKSFLRLGFLIFNCLFMLVVTPTISKAILNLNISGIIKLNIGGQSFNTLNSFFNGFLNNNATVANLVSENFFIASFIEEVPAIITNFIVFILGYFLLKSLTFPIYSSIANKLIKKYKQNKISPPKTFKNKFLGAVLGMLQGGLTGMILFLPLSSLAMVADTANQTFVNINNNANIAITEQLSVKGFQIKRTASTPTPNNSSFNSSNELDKILNVYYNTLLSSTITAMNLNTLNDFIFLKLSSIKINGEEISLGNEIKTATSVLMSANEILYPYNIFEIDKINETDWLEIFSNINYDEVIKMADTLFSLKSLNLIGNDVLILANYEYLQNLDVFNDEQATTPQIKRLADNIAKPIRTGNVLEFKEDIISVLKIAQVFQKHGIMDFAKDTALLERLQMSIDEQDKVLLNTSIKQIAFQIIESLKKYELSAIKTDMVDALVSSPTFRRLMPDIINIVNLVVNDALKINLETDNKVSVAWYNEKQVLASIIYNAKEIVYNLLPYFKDAENNSFGLNNLLELPAENFGALLNSIRESQLFNSVYYQAVPQILVNSINNTQLTCSNAFEFVDLKTIDWQSELTLLQGAATEFINSKNEQTLNLCQMDNLINLIFEKDLTKEVLLKVLYFYPTLLSDKLQGTQNQTLINLVNTLSIQMQQMTLDEIKQDLLGFIAIADNFKEAARFFKKGQIITALELVEKQQIEYALENFVDTKIGSNIIFEVLNILINSLNESLGIQIDQISQATNVNNLNLKDIAHSLYVAKDFYKEFIAIEDLSFDNTDSIQLLQQLNYKELGIAFNTLKNTPILMNVYSSMIKEIVLNKNLLQKYIPSNLLQNIDITETQMEQINWVDEFAFIKDGLSIAVEFLNSKNGTVGYGKIGPLFENYGNTILLNTLFISAVTELFPDSNIEIAKNLNLSQIADFVEGISEIAFLYIDFKYDGPVTIYYMEKYNIKQALKEISLNKNLLAFMEEVTQIKNLDYMQLSSVADVAYSLLEGKEFAIRSLLPYIDSVRLVPWLVDFFERFSKGYKLPYYLNIYMRLGLFDTSINLYSIHLGESVVTDDKNVTTEATDEDIFDLVNNLKYVPNFITAQFVYDPTFEQPIKDN
jgi:hypothetical protein